MVCQSPDARPGEQEVLPDPQEVGHVPQLPAAEVQGWEFALLISFALSVFCFWLFGPFAHPSFALSLFRSFALSLFRSFALLLFCSFVLLLFPSFAFCSSVFCSFALSLFHCFTVSLFCCFAVSLFRSFTIRSFALVPLLKRANSQPCLGGGCHCTPLSPSPACAITAASPTESGRTVVDKDVFYI